MKQDIRQPKWPRNSSKQMIRPILEKYPEMNEPRPSNGLNPRPTGYAIHNTRDIIGNKRITKKKRKIEKNNARNRNYQCPTGLHTLSIPERNRSEDMLLCLKITAAVIRADPSSRLSKGRTYGLCGRPCKRRPCASGIPTRRRNGICWTVPDSRTHTG
jgi:hypothetical protein